MPKNLLDLRGFDIDDGVAGISEDVQAGLPLTMLLVLALPEGSIMD